MSFDADAFEGSAFDVQLPSGGSVTVSWPSQGGEVGSISADTVIIIAINGGEA